MGVSAMAVANEWQRALGRIDGKIDTIIEQMKRQDDRVTDLEVRTRKVENQQYWFSGAGGALGVIFGAVGVKFFHT